MLPGVHGAGGLAFRGDRTGRELGVVATGLKGGTRHSVGALLDAKAIKYGIIVGQLVSACALLDQQGVILIKQAWLSSDYALSDILDLLFKVGMVRHEKSPPGWNLSHAMEGFIAGFKVLIGQGVTLFCARPLIHNPPYLSGLQPVLDAQLNMIDAVELMPDLPVTGLTVEVLKIREGDAHAADTVHHQPDDHRRQVAKLLMKPLK
jgi:hypothetical protein